MTQSLSIILPVRNSQHALRGQVAELLEVLPELTNDFEILVVDDASNDQTEEVAVELSREYPQLQVLRQRSHRGRQASIEAGIDASRGDVVFVKSSTKPIRASEIRKLWMRRNPTQLEMSQPAPEPLRPELLRRLSDWGAALEQRPEVVDYEVSRREAASPQTGEGPRDRERTVHLAEGLNTPPDRVRRNVAVLD